MLRREEYEAFEDQWLAPYAARSSASRGRHIREDEHSYRTAFQKDRDRIIHTTAFRRLEYKTQVFVNYEGDYYRTRLTHTIEASQIGRTIARALRLNEDLTEAISLAHDLGHTPFGHAGEEALNELMEGHGGFDHNRQTLRIVTELEGRYPGFRGLNLTYEVREGIVKHESEYDIADIETQEYEPILKPTLEAQIVNYCDEIAYSTHDLDDGLRSGILTFEQVERAGLTLWEQARNLVDSAPWGELTRHRMIRKLINLLVSDLIEQTTHNLRANNIQTLDDVRRCEHLPVSLSPGLRAQERELKNFLFQNMYRHYRVVRMAVKAQRILRELFWAYIQNPTQLPTNVQARLAKDDLYRVVADYIAGMTDRYATQEYDKLFNPWERP
ncbi:MAG: deoxyguanosinetriphosphate triphosphohydrolase [Ardenticatenaceae bacterium]|nr:deoxyguanosinetriphosphate triphosphohydrolase [Ardenticatenaceae bacterium]HBY95683.1 deoxyguanosinetriphosphate triphosphohydrolase [Chloroflexota bacterium]